MRSLKLTVAMAVLAAFVAGPVLAQSSMSDTTTPATSSSTKCAKGEHFSKKQGKCVASKHRKSKSSSGAASSTTTGQ